MINNQLIKTIAHKEDIMSARIEKLMEVLHAKCKPLFETRFYAIVMAYIIFANSAAILPQTITLLTSNDVSGVSLPMWGMFAAIQTAFALHGIQVKNASIFFSMLASLTQSITIITTVIVRS